MKPLKSLLWVFLTGAVLYVVGSVVYGLFHMM